MSISLTINGISYTFPEEGDENWGQNVTNWAQAATNGMLQKSGGLFTLTSEVDFGASFGVKSLYLKSRAASPASAGIIRLGNAELISWRNAANSADLSVRVSSSNWLQFNSIDLADISSSQTFTNKTLTSPIINSPTISSPTITGTINATDLTITGNTVIGDNSADTLTVNATSSFVAPARISNGSVSAPGLAFSTETNTGIYKLGAGSLAVSVLSTQVALFNGTALELAGQLRNSAGTAALPSISFTLDSNTGLYNVGADILGFSTAGTARGNISAAGLWTIGSASGIETHSILGNATMTFPTAGSRAVFQITHSDSANAASHAALQLTTAGASAGDPYIQFLINAVQNWSIGSDNSDSDSFKISASNFLGTNDFFSISTSGLVSFGSTSVVNSISGDVQYTSASASHVQESLRSVSLSDNTTDNVLTLTAASFNSVIVEYSLNRSTNREVGLLIITHDGTNADFAQSMRPIGDCGVTFSVDINSGNLRLRYTTTATGSAATMKYTLKKWNN